MKTFDTRRTLFAVLIAAAALAGCKGAGFRSAADDSQAKSFAVAQGKSAIYVVRPASLSKMPLAIVLDDKMTARTLPCSYLLWQVDPGTHQILAYGDNITELALRTEAGKSYFVRQDVAGGLWSPRVNLTALDEVSGRATIGDCRLVESGASKK